MTSFDKRPRGRNNRRNGRRNYGSRSSQVIKLNDQGRAFNQQRESSLTEMLPSFMKNIKN